MLWFILAALTGATVLCILWPLRTARLETVRPSDERGFLARQIASLDADILAGTGDAAAHAASRAEIGRRLIAASKADSLDLPAPATRASQRIWAAGLLVLLVPALTFGLFLRLAEPESPAALAKEAGDTATEPSLADVIARAEAHLETHPDDGRGHEVMAPVYMRLGRYSDAANAFAAIIRLLGPTAERHASHGEALYAAGGNIVTMEARTAFEAATALDAANPKARFYLGLAARQEGDVAKAVAIWSALAKDTPTDAPWRAALLKGLADLTGPQSAPQAADAIAGLAAPQQQAMIRQMVERLATRLAADGHDAAGWQKLVRAYIVLGEQPKAREALASARAALAGDAAGSQALDAVARELGVEGQP